MKDNSYFDIATSHSTPPKVMMVTAKIADTWRNGLSEAIGRWAVVATSAGVWWLIECLSKNSPDVVMMIGNKTRHKNFINFIEQTVARTPS
jgi:hypothetical protein